MHRSQTLTRLLKQFAELVADEADANPTFCC
jgi:hypothetical protein